VSNNPITYAYLETTNYCNLQCSFCNRDEVIGALQHMPIPKFREMMEKIKHHPIKEAKLMGMGEPMLHPQFDEVVSIFKEYFPEAFLIVATNCQYTIKEGTQLRERFQRALGNIDLLYFSIDGYKESYERDRSPAKWERLIRFLEDFRDMDRRGCRVTCNYVVNPQNVDDIQKVKDEIIDEYGLEELRLNIAQEWSPDKTLPGGYTKDQMVYLREKWGKNIKGKKEWDYEDCFWVNEGLYTTVEGNVKMCALNTGANPFGNIFETDLEEIRNSEDFQNVKLGCNSNNPTSHCKNCSYKELVPMLQQIKEA
jgi:radical SAM protein with 4Fe4S-binding SPASM domain